MAAQLADLCFQITQSGNGSKISQGEDIKIRDINPAQAHSCVAQTVPNGINQNTLTD